MADPIEVTNGVRVPAGAIEARSVRSSGPGGQNVNKVASRIELLVELGAIEGLDDGARERLHVLTRNKRDADGRLRVTSQESRDRSRNLETAREKVRRLVALALIVPKARRATRPSRAAHERRLTGKKRDARVKGGRRSPGVDD